MDWIDLSHAIAPGMAQYPGDDRPVAFRREAMFPADPYMATSLDIGCHVGTHLDAPRHFLPTGAGVDGLSLARCGGRARVIAADHVAAGGLLGPEAIPADACAGVTYLLLRTGWSRHWGTPRYYDDWPALTPQLARRLAAAGLSGVGIDTPSVDPFGVRSCHDILAAAGMVNVENLTNLEALPGAPFLFVALPLKLVDTEASPVRAAALVDEAAR